MAKELDISVVIRQLEEMINVEQNIVWFEQDKGLLETMLHELGYLRCLHEHGIEDSGRVENVQIKLIDVGR